MAPVRTLREFFDHQAIALIALQADAIASLAFAKRASRPAITSPRVLQQR